MNWITKWRAISAHILSLGEAGNYLLQAFQANDGNYGGVNLVLRELEQRAYPSASGSTKCCSRGGGSC